LYVYSANLRQASRHSFGDFRCRSDWITGEESASGGDGSLGAGDVAVHEVLPGKNDFVHAFHSASFLAVFFEGEYGEVGANRLAEAAKHTFALVYYLRGVKTFDVKLLRGFQNLLWAEFDAEAASFAVVFDNMNLSLPSLDLFSI